MAKNGISTLPTKEQRQIAKLELAKQKRQAVGKNSYRENNVYDVNLLSAKYAGNSKVEDNDPLVPARPWKKT